MSFFLPSENWEKSHRFVCRFFCRPKTGTCRFFCRPKTGEKVVGLYVVFFAIRKLGKSHRFVCRFFCHPKTGKKVIGLYVVFFAVQKLGKKS